VEPLFGRFLGALVAPSGRAPEGALVQYREGVALVELPVSSALVVVLDAAGLAPDQAARRLAGVLEAHQGGMLHVVVTGGGAALRPALVAADREARDPAHVALHHLDDGGRLERLSGRAAPALQRAATALTSSPPVTVAEVPALIERGRKEREEAARFVASTGKRFPPVTTALIAACAVMFGLASLWGGPALTAVSMGANSAELVRQGQVWRLLTAVFLHLNVMHLVVNMIALQSFGGFLEAVLGWRRYLLLYILAGLGGSLASALVIHVHVSVGASGAIWGLMLGGFALTQNRIGLLPARIAAQLRRRLAGVLVLNVLLSFVPGIDYSAHFGGGIVGFILITSGLLVPRGAGDPGWLRAATVMAIVATVVCIATALAVGKPWVPAEDASEVASQAPAQGVLVEVPEMSKVQVAVRKAAEPSHLKVDPPMPSSIIDPPVTVPMAVNPPVSMS
jgi:rhomboid protease GluP